MKTMVAAVLLTGAFMIATVTAQTFPSHFAPNHIAKHRTHKAAKHHTRGDHHHFLSFKKKKR